MNISIEKDNGSVVMKLSGRLDTTTAPELENAINGEGDALKSLVLDFKECVVAIHICAHTYLLPHLTSCMMHVVHLVVIGVIVGSVVAGDTLAINFLYVVFAMYCSKELLQLVDCSNELGVGPVHQLYARHLGQCYRGQ